jgi:secondary thiamine-phosphate synthase enzyme
VSVQHTSASLIPRENADFEVRRDLESLLSHLTPDGISAYIHDTERPDDLAVHAQSILNSKSLTTPVDDRKLKLGLW